MRRERRKSDKQDKPASQYRDLKGPGWDAIEKLPATLTGEKPELTESEKRALWGDR